MGSKDKKSSDEDKTIDWWIDWWNGKTDGQKGGMIVVTIISLIILGLAITSISTSSTEIQATSSPDPVQGITILNSTGEDAAQKYSDGAGDYVIYGKLKNNNSFAVHNVKLGVKGYDKNGNLVSNSTGYTEGPQEGKNNVLVDPNVPAGTIANFTVFMNDPNDQIVRYDIEVINATEGTGYVTYNNTTTTATTSAGDVSDYDRGYDDGYFSGVNDAYDESDYCNNPSTSSMFSDLWRDGFKLGYTHGYNDIKKGRSLETPKVPGAAILDPRTGQTIENT